MLSENQSLKACYRRKEWPLLDTPTNVRIKFRKVGDLQYISHLDLQRTLHRVLVRAGIPMWYTKGFNPHAKIVFSTPLSVGAQSECEMVDIRIDRQMPCDEIQRLLNLEVTDELKILDAYIPTTKFSEIAWARYRIHIHEKELDKVLDTIRKITEEKQITALKKTKSGEKEVDILPYIKSFSAKISESSEDVFIDTVLNITQDNYVNPELLITAIKERAQILSSDDSYYSITRTETYFEDGVTVFR